MFIAKNSFVFDIKGASQYDALVIPTFMNGRGSCKETEELLDIYPEIRDQHIANCKQGLCQIGKVTCFFPPFRIWKFCAFNDYQYKHIYTMPIRVSEFHCLTQKDLQRAINSLVLEIIQNGDRTVAIAQLSKFVDKQKGIGFLKSNAVVKKIVDKNDDYFIFLYGKRTRHRRAPYVMPGTKQEEEPDVIEPIVQKMPVPQEDFVIRRLRSGFKK